MAHLEQRQFFDQLARLFPNQFQQADCILEVGSQDINGSIRDFFTEATNFIGLDIGMAPGVDWTVPGELIELPDQWADISISTECFEHTSSWPKILINMIRITREDGLVILTMAGYGRGTHGTIDSDEGSSPFTTSYYANIGIDELVEKIKFGVYFKSHGFIVNSEAKDTYFWGIRSEQTVLPGDAQWDTPMQRLARAQGQLGQAVHRHNLLQEEIRAVRAVAEQAAEESRRLTEEKNSLQSSYQSLQQAHRELQQEHANVQLHMQNPQPRPLLSKLLSALRDRQ